jgi:hypothetical protein
MILTFVFSFLLTLVSAQVRTVNLPTLYQLAYKNPSKDPLEQKAVDFLIKTHP